MVTKSAGLQKKKQSGALGPRSTNRAEAAKRAEVAEAKKKVKPAHAKAGEKAAGRRNVKLVSVAEPGIPSTAIAGSRDSEEITLKLSRRDSSALARDDAQGT